MSARGPIALALVFAYVMHALADSSETARAVSPLVMMLAWVALTSLAEWLAKPRKKTPDEAFREAADEL